MWPSDSDALVAAQHEIAADRPEPWTPGPGALLVGGCWVCFPRGLSVPGAVVAERVGTDVADGPYVAGLALHLGAALGMPTVGVTHRPLLAEGEWPEDRAGATSPLRIGDTAVGCWLRTRPGARPLAVHPGWRVDLPTAVEVVASASIRRTPEPLRRARHLARSARAQRV